MPGPSVISPNTKAITSASARCCAICCQNPFSRDALAERGGRSPPLPWHGYTIMLDSFSRGGEPLPVEEMYGQAEADGDHQPADDIGVKPASEVSAEITSQDSRSSHD